MKPNINDSFIDVFYIIRKLDELNPGMVEGNIWNFLSFQQRTLLLFVSKDIRALNIRMNSSVLCPVDVSFRTPLFSHTVQTVHPSEALRVRYFESLLRSFPIIRELWLRGGRRFQNCGISLLYLYGNSYMKNHLHTLRATVSGDEALIGIGALLKLRYLDIAESQTVTSTCVKYIKENRNLECLNISGCPNIREDAIQYLADLTNLIDLNMSKNFFLFNDNTFSNLSSLQYLKRLRLRGCGPSLSTKCLISISDIFMNLELLDLCYNSASVTDQVIKIVCKKLTKLQILFLDSCDKISFVGLGHILNFAKNLKYLSLRNCQRFPYEDDNKEKFKLKLILVAW